jgi:hypothetical protein
MERWRDRCLACLAVGFCCLVLIGSMPSTSFGDDPPANNSLAYTPLSTTTADGATAPPVVHVEPISDDLRNEYHINPFYKKCAIYAGIPIIGSEHVSDYAFLECAWTLDHLLHGRKMTMDALLASKVRVGIIAATEYTMDIPENQHPNMIARGAYNDRRSRGLGGLPLATCAEENLLNLRGDPYTRENITIHEFSHTVASSIRRANREWWNRLTDAYNDAKARGDYVGRNGTMSYAMTDPQEYWAEGAQCWFNCANPGNSGGASNRDELKKKDSALALLLTEVYGDGDWRYSKIADRKDAADTAHLVAFDRLKLPIFNFANSPRIQAEAAQRAAAPGNGSDGAKGSDGKSTPNSDGKSAEEKPATPPPTNDAGSGK